MEFTNIKVRLEISDYCNLQCPMCARATNKEILNKTHLSLETVKEWLKPSFLYIKVKHIFLSGAVAEPTLNPECIDIAEYLSTYKYVTIDSNGSTNNEDWWYELGKRTKDKCEVIFSPDSLKPNNNLYRINSNTDKVLKNIKSFNSSGGKSLYKFIIFSHNEDELEEHKKIAKDLGCYKFQLVIPTGWADKDTKDTFEVKTKNKNYTLSKSNIVPKKNKDNKENKTPHEYCYLKENERKLIEISSWGIIYPCCMVPKHFFMVYKNFILHEDPTPSVDETLFNSNMRYQYFVKYMVPLIESQGGIKTLSLKYNSIANILGSNFYKFLLEDSWNNNNKFCLEQCNSAPYVYEGDTF
jgi:MoaA/NifB/PqqE/SkfB family radical SAM enzyme